MSVGISVTADTGTVLGNIKADIINKLKNGENEQTFALGSKTYTQSEWEKELKNFDKAEEALQAYNVQRSASKEARLVNNESRFPYSSYAKDGIIEYNGVIFSGDAKNNTISLGDVSNKNNNLYIPLAKGGTLIVCKDNIAELKDAIGMFSSKDKAAILEAIAAENFKDGKLEDLDEIENEVAEGIVE